MFRAALLSAFALGIALCTDVAGQVRTIDGLTVALGTSESDGASYVSTELTNVSIEVGSIVLSAELEFRIPSLTGREVELWVKESGTELPWDQVDTKKGVKRSFKLVSGDDGLVRFDITRDLLAWSKGISGQPTFYLRVRTEEDNRAIKAVPTNPKLILHVATPAKVDSSAVQVPPSGN